MKRLEYETSVLARKIGLDVPETKCQKLSKAGTTFFSKRFDRGGNSRIHYASAMTMLSAVDGEEDHSYLEIAEWLTQHSAAPEADLHELWRRMVFSHFVKNTDDHLRNHGFLLTSAKRISACGMAFSDGTRAEPDCSRSGPRRLWRRAAWESRRLTESRFCAGRP